jgi:hypothetical protein
VSRAFQYFQYNAPKNLAKIVDGRLQRVITQYLSDFIHPRE